MSIIFISLILSRFVYLAIDFVRYADLSYDRIPKKPNGLLINTFWSGGYWHSCQKTKTDFEYYCIVYSEDGKITWEDDFELYISLYEIDKKIPMKDFQKQTYLTADNVSAFNGDSDIYMQGSLFLKSKNYTWDNPIPEKINK